MIKNSSIALELGGKGMSETVVATCSLEEEQRARAGMYGLLARLLSAPPSADSLQEIAGFPAD